MRTTLSLAVLAALLTLGLPLAAVASAPAGDHGAAAHHGSAPVNWVDFGYGKKDSFGGKLGDGQIGPEGHGRPVSAHEGEEPMPPPFVLALANFAIFAGIVIKFGGPKISAFLAGRHDQVKKDLAEAARLRKDAEDKLAEYSKRMAQVNGEVDKLISEIRADADAEKARLIEEARAQAVAMKKDADERIASEFARARLELEREVVAAAVAAAQKLIAEKASPGDQQALFDGFLDSLAPAGATPGPQTGGSSVSKGWS